MNKNLTGDLSLLYAKIGVFFAKCDNEFHEKEKCFINNFIEELTENKIISEETKDKIAAINNQNISFEDMIQEANNTFGKLNAEEKELLKKKIYEFIEAVITSDGKIHDAEKELFEKFKKQIA